jgi:glycosyltransferase involved in cell wall biosynthesis
MRVLFVSSGNKTYDNKISTIVFKQGESLIESGVSIDYFKSQGKGFKNYIKNINRLRQKLIKNEYDIIHAHYVTSGLLAILTFTKTPIVTSFMGTDIDLSLKKNTLNVFLKKLILFYVQLRSNRIIVKSKNLYKKLIFKKKAVIIPNGVNLSIFKEVSQKTAREKLNLDMHKKYILFMYGIDRKVKNFQLLEKAMCLIKCEAELLTPFPIAIHDVPMYMSACDVLVLTSLSEGSPNVIKEALACNLPIVSTKVGDVKKTIANTRNCYLIDFNEGELAEKIDLILKTGERSNGIERIKYLNIDSISIANKIILLYQGCLKSNL